MRKNNLIHPGEILREEFMIPMKISQNRLALAIGVPATRVGEIVNERREDDLGLEGLRKAKQSYNPIGYERKFMVLQKNFQGYMNELIDHYEAEIQEYGTEH